MRLIRKRLTAVVVNNLNQFRAHACIYWNISASSLAWSNSSLGYIHQESSTVKYNFGIRNATIDWWLPDTQARMIDLDEAIYEEFALTYTGNPNTAETFSLIVTFYAKDA